MSKRQVKLPTSSKPRASWTLGSSCRPTTGARFFAKKYGLDCEDANKLALHPKLRTIVRTVEAWREQNGFPAPNSPMSRAYMLNKIHTTRTALAGSRRRRRR